MKKELILIIGMLLLITGCDIAGKAYKGVQDTYAPPYDIFNNNKPILTVEPLGENEGYKYYKVAVNNQGGIVYNKGYYYTNDGSNKWIEFSFSTILDGESNEWINSPAEQTIAIPSQKKLLNVIVNSCKDYNGKRMCGCIKPDDCGYWMMQTIPECAGNSDCNSGDVCINNICSKSNNNGCVCELKNAVISTSDGEKYTVAPGDGGYTAAEAISWTLEPGPKQCINQETVQIKVTKNNYGEKISEEYITLKKGESRSINHPTIPSLMFSLKLEDVLIECP